MNRRDFSIGSLLAATARSARAQHRDQMRRIAVLMGLAEGDPEAQSDVAARREGLKELGWSEGRNLEIDLRWGAGDANRMRVLAAELVSLQPDVIVGHTTGPTTALP
jgi:putative ABC transport system substrate-binding protein